VQIKFSEISEIRFADFKVMTPIGPNFGKFSLHRTTMLKTLFEEGHEKEICLFFWVGQLVFF
jgi:hypothetical protein